MVEGARLESVYTSKGYRGFESLSLRLTPAAALAKAGLTFPNQFQTGRASTDKSAELGILIFLRHNRKNKNMHYVLCLHSSM